MSPTRITGQLLRVDSIALPSEYERKASLVEDDALRQSIEKSGVQQSVVVHPIGDRFVMIEREIRLAAQPINAIMRSKTLVAMIPDAVREEFERFVEIY